MVGYLVYRVFFVAGEEGLEPPIHGFGDRCIADCAILLYGAPWCFRDTDTQRFKLLFYRLN